MAYSINMDIDMTVAHPKKSMLLKKSIFGDVKFFRWWVEPSKKNYILNGYLLLEKNRKIGKMF